MPLKDLHKSDMANQACFLTNTAVAKTISKSD